jgi:PD-(D/E)XK endonuclease
MATLHSLGFLVLLPFGENSRYDLVIDNGSELWRVQCKTGRLRNGSIRFKTCSSYAHHRDPAMQTRHYQGEIDYFGVHCPETGAVYLIPISELDAKHTATLRSTPARNNQRKRVRAAKDYEVAMVAVSR